MVYFRKGKWKMKSMVVYCGHQFAKNKNFAAAAKDLGVLMASHKIRLVFGGGDVGLMGAIANTTFQNGGDVIGISTPAIVALQEPVVKGVKIEIKKTLSARKQRMMDLADACCILPGGIGTLDELTDILVTNQINETDKPIYLLNIDGYWDTFIALLKEMVKEGFVKNMNKFNVKVLKTPMEVIKDYERNHR
jgi:uncharacterized protein (TIGR00730 family)